MRLVSTIYSKGPDERDHAQLLKNRDKARVALWHKQGIAAIDPKEINDDWIKQMVINIATEQYGARKDGKG